MMKLIFATVFLALGACAAPQPTPAEIVKMDNALRPSSQEAAEKAVVEYFAGNLKDPVSARYSLNR